MSRRDLIEIDGSQGEGGGQVLRSSLSLAVATGQPFHMTKIRARRRKPGLMRQHLTSARAAAALCDARLEGDALGSTELEFHPGPLRAGDHRFSVGTAGSTSLVAQTVLPPLLLADGPSTVHVTGGTHNPMAPPFDFLANTFLPQLAKLGARVTAVLERPGFYPAGGGALYLEIEPVRDPQPLELMERGSEGSHFAEVLNAQLPFRVVTEEWEAIADVLGWPKERMRVKTINDSVSPGNTLSVHLNFETVTEVVTGFGAKGVPARQVGREAATEAARYLHATAPVGEHLADQLLLPLAFLAGGRFRCVTPSLQTRTNIDVIHRFLGDRITLEEQGPDDWVVTCRR